LLNKSLFAGMLEHQTGPDDDAAIAAVAATGLIDYFKL